MNSNKSLSRTAGIFYLIVIVSMIFGEFFVRGKIIDWDNASTTAQNILAYEGLFRLGFVVELIAQIATLVVVLILYHLLKSVNKFHAMFMLSCQIVVVTVHTLNMLNMYAAIMVLKGGPDYLSVFTPEQLDAQALFFLSMQTNGVDINSLFYGLWLLPLGYLIYKSGSGKFSRILGVWLVITFVGFFINFLTRFLIPDFHRGTIFWVSGAMDTSEIVLCFWLLFKGMNIRQV